MAEESDSSCNSSPAPSSLIDIDANSIGSTDTQDSFNVPATDGSDSQSNTSTDFENPASRPIPPPRRRKGEKKREENVVVKDRLIGARMSKDRPKPAPRKSLSDEIKEETVQGKADNESKPESVPGPLIQLESMDDDDFDPFSSQKSQTVGKVETLRGKGEDSPSLLRRTAAVKKQNGRPPRDDSSERRTVKKTTQLERKLEGIETFDPLSNTSEQTQTKEEPRKSVHELMQNWELHNLPMSTNPSLPTAKPSLAQKPHLGFPSPPHFNASHGIHQPLARLSNFSPHQIQQVSVNMSGLRLSNPSVHSSISSQRTSGGSVASADRSSDPFSDLLEQSLLNKSVENPSPKKNWETFD